ncbi:MAG: domain containing protein, partial [Enterovirga sp.]|nr:domain containing protein [Enterovirga sp.]
MSELRELELKLEVSPRQLARLKAQGLEALGEPRSRQRLAATYFDTPDHRLHRKGLTLRVRTADGRHVQTIKDAGEAPGIGLFSRSEWETEVAGPEPDLKAASRTPLKKLLADERGGGLSPVFTAEVERTVWLVETDSAAIEVVLDEGAVAANGARSRLAELELELKGGAPGELFALARRLGGAGALKLGILTKSERGYRLVEGEARRFHKAEPVRLSRGMPVADAFATLVRACLRHFRLNEDGVTEARLPEALLQARVAMRRLRSALSLYREL